MTSLKILGLSGGIYLDGVQVIFLPVFVQRLFSCSLRYLFQLLGGETMCDFLSTDSTVTKDVYPGIPSTCCNL